MDTHVRLDSDGAASRRNSRNIAVVVVDAPAVPIYGARVRFCISAGHKREDLKEALKKIREVCNILNLRYERSIFG